MRPTAAPVGFLPDQLDRDWGQLKLQKEHRERVRSQRGATDASTPSHFGAPHLRQRLKKKVMEEERQAQIYHENQLLLLKMNHILSHKTLDDSTSVARACGKRLSKNKKTANDYKQLLIQRENESLSRRIENIKSDYSRDKRTKEKKGKAHRIVPTRAGKLWTVGAEARSKGEELRATLGTRGKRSPSRGGSLRTGGAMSMQDRTRHSTEAGYRRRSDATVRSSASSGVIVPSLVSLSADEDVFYHTSDKFLSAEALEARKTALNLMADTKRFVGRDLVLGRQKRSLVDPIAVAIAKAEAEPSPPDTATSPSALRAGADAGAGASKEDGKEGDTTAATERWELSIVETGHLSRAQDDLMLGLRVDGVRMKDGATFSMPLDLDMLKGVSQRYDKAAYITLMQATRQSDEFSEVPVYTRLSKVPPSDSAVKLGEAAEGHDVGEKHSFYLGRLVKFIMDRVVLADAEARLMGSLLSFHQRR